MNGLLRRTKRLEEKMNTSTSNERNLNWIRKMFEYVKTDTKPPCDFFHKDKQGLKETFFGEES